MSSSLRRGTLAATFAFAVLPLAACGAGFDAETNGVNPVNASAEIDDIKIQNVNVVVPDGEDGPAAITARLFNDGTEEQTLHTITLSDSGERVVLTPEEGENGIVLKPGGNIVLGGEGNASAFLANASGAGVSVGNAQRVVFDLSDSGEVELAATVVPASGGWDYYESWGPTEPPAPENDEADADEADEADEADADEAEDTSGD